MLIRLEMKGFEDTEKLAQLIKNYEDAKSALEHALWHERLKLVVADKAEAASGN